MNTIRIALGDHQFFECPLDCSHVCAGDPVRVERCAESHPRELTISVKDGWYRFQSGRVCTCYRGSAVRKLLFVRQELITQLAASSLRVLFSTIEGELGSLPILTCDAHYVEELSKCVNSEGAFVSHSNRRGSLTQRAAIASALLVANGQEDSILQ